MKDKRIPRFVFVVGVGRSGTSLLQNMLHSHPRVCFLPETSFLRRYAIGRTIAKLHREGGNDRVARELAADVNLTRLGFDVARMRALVDAVADPPSAPALFRNLLLAYAGEHGDPEWVGDKDPRAVELLPFIHRHYPDARVLHIIRDPRDVLLSKMRTSWSSGHSVFFHVFAGSVQLRMGRSQGRRYFGDAYHELVYERLLADPETVLQEVCDHLGIAFDRAMLDFGAGGRELVAEDEMEWKKETLGPLLSSNTGKWKGQLSADQVALVESACAEAFEAAGYERSNAGRQLGVLSRAATFCAAASMPILRRAYIWYRAWTL